MTATYCGSVDIGASIPAATTAAASGTAGIAAALPDLDDRVAALQAEITALASAPPLPSYAELAAIALSISNSIAAAITVPGLPAPPSIATMIANLTAALTDLLSVSASVQADADVIADFEGYLNKAGVHVIVFDGDLSALGSDLQASIDANVGTSGSAHAILLTTTSTVTWSAMQSVFKVTP